MGFFKSTGKDSVPQKDTNGSVPATETLEMGGMKYIKDQTGLYMTNINELGPISPLGLSISKETGKLVVGEAQFVKSIKGVILQYWAANVLFEDGKLICSGVNGKPIVDNPKSKGCEMCPFNKFENGHKKCKNMIVLLLKTPEYALPLRVTLPPTNLSAFRKATLLPIAQGIPLYMYDITLTTSERTSKDGIKFYNYSIDFEQREQTIEYFDQYIEYATTYFDSISNMRITKQDIKIVDVDAENEESNHTEVEENLPF